MWLLEVHLLVSNMEFLWHCYETVGLNLGCELESPEL